MRFEEDDENSERARLDPQQLKLLKGVLDREAFIGKKTFTRQNSMFPRSESEMLKRKADKAVDRSELISPLSASKIAMNDSDRTKLSLLHEPDVDARQPRRPQIQAKDITLTPFVDGQTTKNDASPFVKATAVAKKSFPSDFFDNNDNQGIAKKNDSSVEGLEDSD